MSIQDSILQKNISMQKLSFLPTLGASFSYSWNAMSNGNAFRRMDFNPYSYVALQLSVPLFTGGSRWYGLKDARLQRKELQLQRENLVSSLQMQTELAIDNINREANQIEASQKGMEQAARAYDKHTNGNGAAQQHKNDKRYKRAQSDHQRAHACTSFFLVMVSTVSAMTCSAIMVTPSAIAKRRTYTGILMAAR